MIPSQTPMPSTAPAVATGRLGRLHTRAVVDDAIGTMLGAVERIAVASHELAVVLRDTLVAEVDRWASAIDHVNVFQYDAVRVEASFDGDAVVVELQAARTVAKHLHGIVREFGRLHATVVRHYMRAVVHGLSELHQHGLACGGLSLSNLFLCEGRVQVGAWFPPISVMQQLHQTNATLFADNPFAQSVLRRVGEVRLLEQQQRDLRSLAFLIVEMRTGERVMLNQLTAENDELLAPLPANSMERAFVLELLQPTASLKTIATHPYLMDERVSHPSASALSQRELIAVLIDKELTQCRSVQRADAQQVRAWFAQFEKRFHRKPQTDERPATIQRLQQRCRALHERIQELERRVKVLGFAAQSAGQILVDAVEPASAEVQAPDINNQRTAKSTFVASSVSALDISDSVLEPDGLVDHRRRSPAQNAFLRQLSHDDRGVQAMTASPKNMDRPQTDAVAGRGRAHELLHQRKEVMKVIRGLEE